MFFRKKLSKVLDSLIEGAQRAADAYADDNDDINHRAELTKRDSYILIRDMIEYDEFLKHMYKKFVTEDKINEIV